MHRKLKLVLSLIVAVFVGTIVFVIFVLNYVNFTPQIDEPLAIDFDVNDPVFLRTIENLLGPPFSDGNSIQSLRNGDEIFPAMLAAIRGAETTINFQTYVYWQGAIAIEFAEALAERSAAGVEVRLLLDAVGSGRMDDALVDNMTEAGVVVRRFRVIRWFNLDRLNNRTHRKLLIVDGRTGFTGGVGIGDEWLGDAQDAEHWRDTHFEIQGPLVLQLQAGFADNWLTAQGEILQGEKFFPELQPVGAFRAQAFNSSANKAVNSIRTLFLIAIASAQESIHIGTPYFVPDSFLLETLVDARHRGVRVEVLTQGDKGDSRLAQIVSTSLWGELLKEGVEIYRFDPTLYHTKVLIIDRKFTSIGSTNFDNRSFLFNDENNVNVIDRDFAENMLRQFEQDKTRASSVSYEVWLDRPWYQKLLELFSGLIKSQV